MPMRPFVVTLALGLGLVVAVNGIAAWDAHRRAERQRSAAARLVPGLTVAFDVQMDERRFQQARLDVIPAPRVVAFGSSRVRDVSTATAGMAPGTFYNLGMSAAGVDDYVALWSLLRRRGLVPEVAVFSVDAWALSGAHDEAPSLSLADEVASPGPLRSMRIGASWALYAWYQAKELLSFTVLNASARDLDRALHGRRRRGDDLVDALSEGLMAESEVGARQAIRADGSVIRPAAMRDRAPDQIRGDVQRHVAEGAYGLADFRWDAERAARLERLWREMASQGVRVVAYMPPYHPAAWATFRGDPRYRSALDAASRFLADASRRVGARFVDASDPSTIPCAEADFYDMQHASPACLARLWSALLSNPR